MPSKSQKNSNVTSILKEDFKLKNKSSSKLISLNRTAKRAGLTKKALACAMSFLMFCPSATVSGTYTPVTESKITTSMESAEKISGSTFSEIVETVKKYVKDNPGKSAAEITIFIAILVIGGYLIFKPRKPQVHPMVTPPIQQKTEDQPQPQQTTSNPEQPSALPKPTLQGAPATPPRKQPTNPQHHSATPMPTGGKVRSRITVNPNASVSSAPNPRSVPSGTSIPTHVNIPTANQPTPPPLPAPLPGSSTNPASKLEGGSGRSSGRGSHHRQNATLTASSSRKGSSNTGKPRKEFPTLQQRMAKLQAAATPPSAPPPTNGSTRRTAVSDKILGLQRKVGSKAVNGLKRQQPAANSRPSSPASTSSGAATSETPIPSVSARPTRPRRPDKLPDGYDRAAELFEQYLYDPAFNGRDPKSNPEYNRLCGELLRALPANGKIPGATLENGAAEVFAFLRNGPMALNNAFAKMRKGEVLVCMQGRHNAGDPNNDKYAGPSSR